MRRPLLVPLAVLSLCSPAQAERLRFLNKTAATITELRFSPPGSGDWGANQTDNDSDRAVDADEGLNLKGLTPGRYDVKLGDKTGRSCIVRDVVIESGHAYALTLSETELKDCKK
jgi:hypothetical protein